MHSFSNQSLNKLHIHYGLVRFGSQFINILGMIVLYKMGYPLWQVFLFWGAFSCGEFLFRFVVLRLLSRAGLKNTIMLGSIAFTLITPIFYLATQNVIPVLAYIFLLSLTCALYWYPFHILYGLVGDQEKRGRQSAIKESAAKIAYGIGPVLSGIIFKFFGATGLFLGGAMFYIFAFIVLLSVKEYPQLQHKIQSTKEIFENTPKSGLFISLFFSFQEVLINVLWGLVLFFLFNEDTAIMGGILSFVMILRIVIEYFVGKSIDFQHQTQWYYLGAIVIATSVIGRAFFGFSIDSIILFDVVLMLGYSLFSPYESVFIYNSIKDSLHPESFTFLVESGGDFGSIIGYFLAALLIYNTSIDMRYLMPIGIIVFPCIIFIYKNYFSLIQKPLSK